MGEASSSQTTVVVDYGLGNLLSLSRALESVGQTVRVSRDAEDILAAHRVVLPGVGSFSEASRLLHTLDLVAPLVEVANMGTPLLGICLGMQLLFEEGHEHGTNRGLALLPGEVIELTRDAGSGLRRTHIGWRELSVSLYKESEQAESLLLDGNNGPFYFVHSFVAVPGNPAHTVATVPYGTVPIVAAVRLRNISGVQFHPEKSGRAGLDLLARFGSLSASGL